MQRQIKEVIFQIDMYFCFVPRVLKAPSFQNGSVFFFTAVRPVERGVGQIEAALCVGLCSKSFAVLLAYD